MHADVAGVLRIARLASTFDWTWTAEDLDRFCRTAGWTRPATESTQMLLGTGLDLVVPRAFACTNAGSISSIANTGLLLISVPVAGQPTGSGDGWLESPGDAFATVAQRLIGPFGGPDRCTTGPMSSIAWLDLPNLVVSLEFDDDEIALWLRNPSYQEWLDKAIECDGDDDGDERSDDNVEQVTIERVDSSDWQVLAGG
ncbi:DUF6301 family protein [Nocardia salmonicida]|uniref:DUF6301 family protein n=1 Tax=Nocardia salmonicida TaxID=53431 RepID=UPI00364820CB